MVKAPTIIILRFERSFRCWQYVYRGICCTTTILNNRVEYMLL